jgi:hypothetical protein
MQAIDILELSFCVLPSLHFANASSVELEDVAFAVSASFSTITEQQLDCLLLKAFCKLAVKASYMLQALMSTQLVIFSGVTD